MSGYEVWLELMADPYYETVDAIILAVVVETAVQVHGPFSSYEELNQYIKKHLLRGGTHE